MKNGNTSRFKRLAAITTTTTTMSYGVISILLDHKLG